MRSAVDVRLDFGSFTFLFAVGIKNGKKGNVPKLALLAVGGFLIRNTVVLNLHCTKIGNGEGVSGLKNTPLPLSRGECGTNKHL